MIDRLIEQKKFDEADSVIKNAIAQVPETESEKLHLKRATIL